MILTIFYTFILLGLVLLIVTLYVLKKYKLYTPISVKQNNEPTEKSKNEPIKEHNNEKKNKNRSNNNVSNNNVSLPSINKPNNILSNNYPTIQENNNTHKLSNNINKNVKGSDDLQYQCQAFMKEKDKPKYKNADPNRKLYKGYEWQGRPIEDLGNCNKKCHTCSVISSSLQPSLWGTTLEEAERTDVGSILPKFIYKELDYEQE